MSEFKVIPAKLKKKQGVSKLLYRFNDEAVRKEFNRVLQETGLSGQMLLDQMIKHCLKRKSS